MVLKTNGSCKKLNFNLIYKLKVGEDIEYAQY